MTKSPRLFNLYASEGSNELTDEERTIIEFRELVEQIEGSIAFALNEYATRADMTLLEGLALRWVFDLEDQARIGAIAEKVRIPLSTMTGVANRLEKRGLVERHRAPDDGRAFVLRLTNEGFTHLEAMFIPFFEDVSGILREEDRGAIPKILEGFREVAALGQKLEARVREKRQPR